MLPRNVRNFWIEVNMDGKKTPVALGPVGHTGGFEISVSMRNKDKIEHVVWVEGNPDGQDLALAVVADNGKHFFTVTRER